MKILLLTSKNDEENNARIAQRVAQIKTVNADAIITIQCIQGTEEAVLKDCITAINSDNYSLVILDSELSVHPWLVMDDYRHLHPGTNQPKFILEGDVNALTSSFIATNNFMGNILVVKDGSKLIEIARGNVEGQQSTADALPAEEMQANTQHNICSITKMLTGLTVLKLAEKNPAVLNNFIYTYLPDDFPQREEYRWVTVGNLLTHTSGMGDYTRKYHDLLDDQLPHKPDNPIFNRLSDITPFIDAVSFEEKSPTQRGSRYSNLGFAVLGEVIEHAINADNPPDAPRKSYWDAIEEYILIPAEAKIVRDNPTHDKSFATNSVFPTTRHIASTPAGGNVWATAEDLVKFANWVIEQHKGDPKFQPLLQSLKELGSGYAFGVIQREIDGEAVYCHGGGAPGISSDLRIYPADNAAIVVLSNNNPRAATLGERLESNVLKAPNVTYISKTDELPQQLLHEEVAGFSSRLRP